MKPDSSKNFSYSPMTSFEEYMRLDQKRDFPMTQEMTWTFEGTVDADVLAEALRTAIAREPLYGATVRRRFRPFGRYYWRVPESAPLEFSQVEVSRDFFDDRAGAIPLTRLDLKNSGGFRVVLERGPKSFRIRTSVHHSITDGLGIARFMGRWFEIYESLLNGETVAPERLARLEFFPNRERLFLPPTEPIPTRVLVSSIVSEVVKWFWRRPIAVGALLKGRRSSAVAATPPSAETPRFSQDEAFQSFAQTFRENRDAAPRPTLHWLRVSPEIFDAYRRRARAQNVGVNTLLLRDIFLALKNWTRNDFGIDALPKRRYFRVLVPTSLRAPEDAGIPLVNRLGYVFLDKKPNEMEPNDAFLKDLGDTMAFIRKWSSGAMFLDGVRFFRRIPGALSLLTSRLFCHSTVVFSNVGVLCKSLEQERFRESATIEIAGKLRLIGIVGAPPVRPNTPLSIGVISHNGAMFLSCCVDERRFDAERFLAFFEELTRTALDSTDSEPNAA